MKKIMCIAMALCIVFTNASAMTLTTDNYTSGIYNVAGEVDAENIPVKIEVLNNCVFEAESASDYTDIDVMYSDADKKFAFAIPVSNSGNHVVNIIDFYGNKKSTVFRTYDDSTMKTEVESFLSNYASRNINDLESLIKSYYLGLDVDYKDILRLSNVNKNNFYTNAYASVDSALFETFSDLVKAELGIILVSQDGKLDDLKKYETVLKIFDENYYNDYKVLTDVEKQLAVTATIGSTNKTILNNALREKVIILTLKNSEWSNLSGKLTYYEQNIAGLSSVLSAITSLSDTAKKKIYTDLSSYLKNGTITSTTQLTTQLTALKETYKDVKDPVPQGGSSSGSGSSSGKGNSFIAPSNIPEVPHAPFKDLSSVSWASAEIIQLYEDGIVKGDENGNFNPGNTVTREEFVSMIVRAFDFYSSSSNSGFSDVPADRWSSGCISAARENGIVNGISETLFGATENIKRCDMAVMAYNALKKLGIEILSAKETSFKDKKDIPDYALEAVNFLSQMEIIKGNDGKFLPDEFATRAEAAVIIRRTMTTVSK